MLNLILSCIAIGLWSFAYGWYFQRELRAAWWRWRHRKELAMAREARAYAAWIGRPLPVHPVTRAVPARQVARSRPPPPLKALPAPPRPAARPAPRPSATILPFRPRARRDPSD